MRYSKILGFWVIRILFFMFALFFCCFRFLFLWNLVMGFYVLDYFVFKFGFWSVCLRYFEVWTSTGLRLNDSFSFRLWGVILFLVFGAKNFEICRFEFYFCYDFWFQPWYFFVWMWSKVFGTPMFPILLFILIFMMQRTSMTFKSWFRALEDTRGYWLGFGNLILIQFWSLVFDTTMFQILALYLNFEDAKNNHVL